MACCTCIHVEAGAVLREDSLMEDAKSKLAEYERQLEIVRARQKNVVAEYKSLGKERSRLIWILVVGGLAAPIGLFINTMAAPLIAIGFASIWLIAYYIASMHLYQRREEVKILNDDAYDLQSRIRDLTDSPTDSPEEHGLSEDTNGVSLAP